MFHQLCQPAVFQVNEQISKVITKVLDKYSGNNSTTEQAWDFIQTNVSWKHGPEIQTHQ